MGPLIPQGFVNPDLNLFFAFVIGLGFGYVLEQAGFSSSRKLAGVFYGYDFVVLRVFFTAAITAASGLLLFNYLGWIEYDMLYINPTYVWSAIVGGLIMGGGFIMGGFCPGTSIVAAVIGKIDAMFFVVGLMIGIFFFGTFYDLFEPLYNGHYLGSIFVFDSLGISRSFFAFMLIVIALAAFIITKKIEDHVNGRIANHHWIQPAYRLPFALMMLMAVLIVILPDRPKAQWHETSAKVLLQEAVGNQRYVTANELAYKLLHPKENDYLLVDVRNADAFAQFNFPGAVNIPLSEITVAQQLNFLRNSHQPVLLYSFGNTDADQAWLVLRRDGIQHVKVLKDGINGFFNTLFVMSHKADSTNEMQLFETRFLTRAAEQLKSGGAAVENSTKARPVKTIVEILPPAPSKGGC